MNYYILHFIRPFLLFCLVVFVFVPMLLVPFKRYVPSSSFSSADAIATFSSALDGLISFPDCCIAPSSLHLHTLGCTYIHSLSRVFCTQLPLVQLLVCVFFVFVGLLVLFFFSK